MLLFYISDGHFNQTMREIKNSSNFRISPVMYENAGLYECIADNGIPPKIRTNFSLTIRGINFKLLYTNLLYYTHYLVSFILKCNLFYDVENAFLMQNFKFDLSSILLLTGRCWCYKYFDVSCMT